MTTPIRGLHLYANRWIGSGEPEVEKKHDNDLCFIDQIGNLNSVKTAIFSYRDQSEADRISWLRHQRDKIQEIRQRPSLRGNTTFVFRCWPVYPSDFICDANGNVTDWYGSGEEFARNLADAFDFIQSVENGDGTHGIPYAFMEVGNEPNVVTPDPKVEPFGGSSAHYNDFFRGFYWGERQVGVSYPLIYAGLSGEFNPNAWYQDYWVQAHIRDYAAKIGVHIYWHNNGGREQEFVSGVPAGRYYRWIKRTLEAAGVGARGLVITEFGTPRREYGDYTLPATQQTQIAEECAWWRGTYQDTLNGWWTEQAFLFVSNTDDPDHDKDYALTDYQTQSIQLC